MHEYRETSHHKVQQRTPQIGHEEQANAIKQGSEMMIIENHCNNSTSCRCQQAYLHIDHHHQLMMDST